MTITIDGFVFERSNCDAYAARKPPERSNMIPEHLYTSVEMYVEEEETQHAFRALLAVVREQDKAMTEMREQVDILLSERGR
jgi:hypothetical protein